MKSQSHPSPRPLTRTAAALLAAGTLAFTAGCGGGASWLPFGKRESTCESAIESLETRFEDLRSSVANGDATGDRTAFWQAASAVFVVISGFALVAGASLGSRARRDRERFHQANPDAGAE